MEEFFKALGVTVLVLIAVSWLAMLIDNIESDKRRVHASESVCQTGIPKNRSCVQVWVRREDF